MKPKPNPNPNPDRNPIPTLTSPRQGAGGVAGAECTDAQGAPLALRCGMLVDCAGPYARAVGVAMGGDAAALPLLNEAHA